MHVVNMTGMLNLRVSTGRAMLMRVPFVTSASHSNSSSETNSNFQLGRLERMFQSIGDQVSYVPIHQSVPNVFSILSRGDQPLASQDFKPLRNHRKTIPRHGGQFTHTPFTICQERKDLQPTRISHRAENPRRPLYPSHISSCKIMTQMILR
jgi:hypothetical protein